MFYQQCKKAISFKQALVVVILLHVIGYCAVSGYSSHRAKMRKQALIAKKEKEAELQRLINKNTSSMFPQRGKPVVVAVSPFKTNKNKEKHKTNKQEESPIRMVVNTLTQFAIKALIEKAGDVLHTSPNSLEQQAASQDNNSFKAGFCPNPTAIRSSFVPDNKNSVADRKLDLVIATPTKNVITTSVQPIKSKPQTVYSKTTTIKYPQLNQEALKSEFLKIRNQIASVSEAEKEVIQTVRSNIHPNVGVAIDGGKRLVKLAQDGLQKARVEQNKFNNRAQSAEDYIHEEIVSQVISSNIIY